jgi:ankyrin repeat protein
MRYKALIIWIFGFGPALVVGQTLDDLFRAVETNNIGEVSRLLARGMDPNSSDPDGRTLLMRAAWDGQNDLIKVLLDRKAKVEQRNARGETAIMMAAFRGHLEAVKLLHERGASLGGPGWTPLHYASFNGSTPVVKYLLDSRADIDARAPNGATPLMFAARGGHLETAKLLIWQVADVNAESDRGETALMWALQGKNTDIAKLLQQAGAKR